jgi:type IX secretion system PorP/SprF family membrane protein
VQTRFSDEPHYTINKESLRYFVVFRRFYWLLILCAIISLGAKAQYDPHFSHYYGMEAAYNPAAVGKESKLNVVGAYAMNLAGFENNPRTFYVGGDMPFYALNSYHGAGINLMNDQIGIFTHQRVSLQYSYKMKLAGGTLGIGLQAGFLNESLKASDLDLADKNDPAFSSSDTNGNALDLGAGVYYQHGRWYAGASVQHATSPLVELGELNEFQIDRTYYLTGGYNIKLRNPFLSIPVSVLGMSDGVSYRGDVTARLVYTTERRTLMAGVGYSPTNSVTVMVGGSFHGINVGYSYEAYTNGISLGNGSHELFVSYQTDLNLYKKGKNKHKSVRLL